MRLQGKNEGRLLLLRTGRKIESSVIYWNFPDQSVNLDMIFKVINFQRIALSCVGWQEI